jgi:hypothetical protein
MAQKRGNKQPFFAFLSKLTQLVSEYAPEQLRSFAALARQDFPSMEPVIEACAQMAGMNRGKKPDWSPVKSESSPGRVSKERSAELLPLFVSREIFPTSTDLGDFAERILPGINKKRMSKISREKGARRILEYLARESPEKRDRLERAMLQAIERMRASGSPERQGFFAQWEKIVKDTTT